MLKSLTINDFKSKDLHKRSIDKSAIIKSVYERHLFSETTKKKKYSKRKISPKPFVNPITTDKLPALLNTSISSPQLIGMNEQRIKQIQQLYSHLLQNTGIRIKKISKKKHEQNTTEEGVKDQ